MNWHSIYFFRLLIPYILGVFTSLYILNSLWEIALIVLSGLLLSILYSYLDSGKKFSLDWLYGVALFLLMFGLGSFRHFSYNEINSSNHFSKNTNSNFMLVEIVEEPLEKINFVRCKVKVKGGFDSAQNYSNISGSILTYFKKPISNSIKIGDEILINSSKIAIVQGPRNPGEFNYKRFLSYKNIYYQIFLNPNDWKKTGLTNTTLFSIASESRKKVLAKLADLFPDNDKRAFSEALLLGYKNNLNTEIVDSFSKTGTLHVLAVSGLHAGIIFLILSFILKPFDKFKFGYIPKVILIVLGMWYYAFVTGLSPSVMRAALMLSIVQCAILFGRKPMIYNSIFASAFLILLVNPLLIVSVGFQLSYAAVLGIVFFQPKIRKWYLPSTKFGAYCWSLIAVSLAAQIATFPLGVFYFYQFPSYFLLSNLIVIPAIFLTMSSLIASVALYWIPFVGKILVVISEYLISSVFWVVQGIETLPNASIDNLYLNPFQLILVYLLILSISWWLIQTSKNYLKASFILIIALLTTSVFRAVKVNKQDFIVVHSINKHSVVSVVKGRELFVIADSSFLQNSSSKRFYLRPFISENGIKNVKYLNWNTAHHSSVMEIKDSVLFVNNKLFIKRQGWILYSSEIEKKAIVQSYKSKWELSQLNKKGLNPEKLELENWIKIEKDKFFIN